jgi:hypothetical protein
MVGAVRQHVPILSVAAFRAWLGLTCLVKDVYRDTPLG